MEQKKFIRLYNSFCEAIDNGEIIHSKITIQELHKLLCEDENGVVKYIEADNVTDSFAAGCIDINNKKIFITMIVVDREYRRKGIGRKLLSNLEQELLKLAAEKDIYPENVEISFFNPCTFTWDIPGTSGVSHPNTPGVDVASEGYMFFKNCKYIDFAAQNSYYLDLEKYEMADNIKIRKESLAEQGVSFEVYYPEKHTGMKELINSFDNTMWDRDILGEPAIKDGGRPILVPVYENEVCGFTGPLAVCEDGRGFFAGIGVGEKYRGKGIAKVLFGELCSNLKEMGAGYMTLFTGEHNKARNIYEEVGFKVVRSWSDMRKKVEVK